MKQTCTAATGFACEAEMLVNIAARLGNYCRDGARPEFVRTLMAMGVSEEKAASYWEGVDRSECGSITGVDDLADVRDNTQLASRLGVLLDSGKFPRNELVYCLLQRQFPDFFEVQVTGTRHMGGKESRGNPPGRRLVTFPKQPSREVACNGHRRIETMSAYKVYQGIQPSQFSERVLLAADPLRLALGEELGLQIANLLIGCKMEIPSYRMSDACATVLNAGMRGETITLAGAFCPDYAYEETGNPQLPFRYTFDGLGEGVGLVARQFARITPQLSGFLSDMGIPHRIVLSIADFEADSDDILAQVGVGRDEFIRRCRRSLDAFRQSVPSDLPLDLELFGTERDKGRMRGYADHAIAEMRVGRFGMMPALHRDLSTVLSRIPDQYRTFYERWYGRSMVDLEVNNIVHGQGGEYAAVARIYHEDFGDNLILLAGDRPEMNKFNSFYTTVPTLCAKRAY